MYALYRKRWEQFVQYFVGLGLYLAAGYLGWQIHHTATTYARPDRPSADAARGRRRARTSHAQRWLLRRRKPEAAQLNTARYCYSDGRGRRAAPRAALDATR